MSALLVELGIEDDAARGEVDFADGGGGFGGPRRFGGGGGGGNNYGGAGGGVGGILYGSTTLSANTYVLPFVIVYQGNYSKIETLRILTYQGIEQLVRLLNAAKTSKSELLTPAVVFTGEPLY